MRKIIHIDMDAFYASIEQRENPSLRGKPVIVGGSPRSRGVVATCSYEARRYGVHSAMSSARAHRLCPHAIFIMPDGFELYRHVSRQIRDLFYRVTDKVETLALDEAYLNVTQNALNEPSATRVADHLRRNIAAATGLTASAGVSYNKFLAKVASDWKKPDGLTVIPPEKALDFIAALPVEKFWGVGAATAARMKSMGIHKGGDLQKSSSEELQRIFGKVGLQYFSMCRGIDEREIVTERIRKSIGKERTFPQDITDFGTLTDILETLAARLWDDTANFKGRTVTVKVKYADFTLITRRRSFPESITNQGALYRAAVNLLTDTEAGRRPIRLLGLSLSSFNSDCNRYNTGQMTLKFRENVLLKPDTVHDIQQ